MMKRNLKRGLSIGFLAISIFTFMTCVLTHTAGASPSKTLVVYNDTGATLTVVRTSRSVNKIVREVKIPPNTKKSCFNFLNYGYNDVYFTAYCVSPLPKQLYLQLIAQQGGQKNKRVRVAPKDFGLSSMFDAPGCGGGKTKTKTQGERCRSWDITPKAAIYLENKDELKPVTLERCKSACNKRDWCRSFDYSESDSWCLLSDKTAADVGGLKRDYPGHPWDYYECK
ncbi:PAN domain-containing protein [Thermodesulfobacteriota bacterium]